MEIAGQGSKERPKDSETGIVKAEQEAWEPLDDPAEEQLPMAVFKHQSRRNHVKYT